MNTKTYTDIDFADGQRLAWLGRNGQFKSKGIALTHTEIDTIMIEPRTTQGNIGRCLIEFPVSAIPEITAFLNQYLNTTPTPAV